MGKVQTMAKGRKFQKKGLPKGREISRSLEKKDKEREPPFERR